MKYRTKYLKSEIQLELTNFFKARGVRLLFAVNDNKPEKLSAVFDNLTTTPISSSRYLHACLVMKLIGSNKKTYATTIEELRKRLEEWQPLLNALKVEHFMFNVIPATRINGKIVLAQWAIIDPKGLLEDIAA